ncbi:MAG TPA: acetylglutamate kinase [Candidatus Ratteibacteria bacterium]|nr:acetylglutamate kinase [bacterium]HPC28659.1 acetylglutamate kinase [bacterium]HRS05781.1 acetylglutamate kinase [Candidatus Ratteibacteria bacterium]HRV03422.1 acetylglutamate kinase [Candidatus Ratteibacteria bacterium]
MDNIIFQKAEALTEALPYIQRYKGKIFVIKIGGAILRIPESRKNILHDVAFLNAVGIKTVIVCGAGPAITEEIEKRGKKVKFIEGLRITDADVLEIVVEVLGSVRDEFARDLINEFKTPAFSLKPEDGHLIARKIHWQKGDEVIDLGFVGQVESVNTDVIKETLEKGIVIFAPVGISKDGQKYNINGDSVSSSVAQSLGAEKLIFVSGVKGVMRNLDNSDTLISVLTASQAEGLINEGVIHGGMIPKVKGAIASLKGGVKKVHIISGNIAHSLILEIFTEQGIGTEIILDGESNG